MKRSQLPATLQMDAAMALLLGPVLYGHVFHKESHPEPFDFGGEAAKSFWRAYGVESTKGTEGSSRSLRSVNARKGSTKEEASGNLKG
jgi:hypothetical protein